MNESVSIGSVLQEKARNPKARFVFPSSVAADFWARECLLRGWAAAVEANRFLGWDRFRDSAFRPSDASGRTADKHVRLLFASELLRRNAEAPFLRALIQPERADGWRPFAAGLARALPSLWMFLGQRQRRVDLEAADYVEVAHRYGSFLAQKGLVEPAWNRGAFDPGSGAWTIFFPELMEDFPDYEEALAGNSAVSMMRIPGDAHIPPVEIHARMLDEIGTVLDDIRDFIEVDSTAIDGVVITCPDLDALRPYLAREARLRGVPLDFRSGAPLSSHPAGRIFERIADLTGSGFPYEGLRDLVMDSGLSWREGGAAAELLSFGARMTVARGWKDGGKDVDAWEAAFREAGDSAGAGMKAFYRGLKANALAIVGARDFKAIKGAWTAFSKSMLDPLSWKPEANRVIGRCVACLDALDAAKALGGFDDIEGAYGIFASALAEERYVGASSAGGARVYDYRVSAGIEAARHYVINASEDGVSVRAGELSFLREDLREGMGFVVRDMSAAFLRAYGLSGKLVSISCSLEGADGAQMPHGAFELRMERDLPDRTSSDPNRALGDYFARKARFPASMAPSALRGLEYASRVSFKRPITDWTSGVAERRGIDVAGRAAIESLSAGMDEGVLALSPSMIARYRNCPVSWLWESVLGAGKEPEGIAALDTAFIGSAYHKALQYLYEEGDVVGAGGVAAEDRIEGALRSAASSMARRRGPLARVIIEMSGSDIALVLRKVAEADAALMPGASVVAIEREASASFPEIGIVVRGRLDRLMRSPCGQVIVDYKSSGNLRRSDYAPVTDGSDVKDLVDVQFPAYALILKEGGLADGQAHGDAGGEGVCALAFSIGKRTYVAIAADEGERGTGGKRKAVMDKGTFSAAAAKLLESAAGIAGELRAMSYPLPSREDMETACGSCPTRNVCRERYNVR